MNVSDVFVAIAARAVGKSWLCAVFGIAKAILWPGSEIVIVSQTQKQAGLIVSEKIARLRDDYPNVAREIRDLTANNNKWEVNFHNGSKIRVVAAGESGRGARSTFTIYEEFRLIEKEVIDTIVRPFAYSRQPNYLKEPQYSHLVEEPKEVFISSAYYRQHWWFDLTKQVMKMMIEGKSAGVIFLDWMIAVHHGIKTKKQLEKEKLTMSSEAYDQEYCNLVLGNSEKSYFSLGSLVRSRTLKSAMYPQREDSTYSNKKNPYASSKRSEGEIRLLAVDVAMRSGSKNDNTIMAFIRLIPMLGKGYLREVSYMESHNGMNSVSQALRIKQLVEDFDIDTVVLDVANAGIAIYDSLGLITKDVTRGKEYPAMTVMEHASIDDKLYGELFERTLSVGAKPMIYPVISSTLKQNSDMAILLKDRLKKKLFSFLINENEAEDVLMKNKTFLEETRDDSFIRAWYLHPFVQTSLMISEILGLDMSLVNGNIKLTEKSGSRKDRYTAIAYGNYYASLLDSYLLRDGDEEDEWELIKNLTFVF